MLERTSRPLPDACHSRESSVELGAQYLDRIGLRDYMRSRQPLKFGIRFFPGGGDRRCTTATRSTVRRTGSCVPTRWIVAA